MKNLEPVDAMNLIQTNSQNPDFVLLDLRRVQDYRKFRLAGAINLPFIDEDFERKLKKMNRQNQFLIYCSADTVSNITAEIMEEMNFVNVSKIAGGIFQWQKQGLPTIS